jgi:hypothetical protein
MVRNGAFEKIPYRTVPTHVEHGIVIFSFHIRKLHGVVERPLHHSSYLNQAP